MSTRNNQRLYLSAWGLGSSTLTGSLLLAGCSHSPEYSIFGSFFPAWIFCSAGGLLVMAGARAALSRTAIAEHIAAPVLFYLSLATFLSCVLWLLFYAS